MSHLIRAVVDSNVMVSGLIAPAGTPGRLLDAWKLYASYDLVVSERLAAELEGVVIRDKFRPYFSLDQAREFLRDVRQKSVVAEEGRIRRVSTDPKDDYLVALAIAGEADYLVSGDKHLHDLGPGAHPPVVTPGEFLYRLEERG